MKKRITSLLICGLLGVGAIAGCGGSNDSDVVKLTVWGSASQEATLIEMVEEFKKRLQFPLCRSVEGGAGDWLSENRHLHSGHGERGQSAGRWLGVRWAGWRQTLDGEPPPQGGLIPGADEIPL